MEFSYEDIISEEKDNLALLIKELRLKVIDADLHGLVPRTDDAFLSKFLRTKNFKLESAFDSLCRYYGNVNRNLNFISGVYPSELGTAFESPSVYVLKKRSEGRRVGVVHVGHWRPKELSLRELQLSSVIITETVIEEDETQEKGIIVVFDFGGLGFEHLRRLTPREIKRILLTGQEGLPLKIHAVHIVNAPPLFWTLHHLAMRFVKEKIRKRVHFHSTLDTLHQHIDQNILPIPLGGVLTESEARDNELVDKIVSKNLPYEHYWNGGKFHKKLNRKRSSLGELCQQ